MRPIAIWNSARDAWEIPQTEGLFCEHLDVFLGTFPTSGMTASGVAYELPTWDSVTDDSASSSLLSTPNARGYKGAPSAAWAEQSSLPRDVERLLPTICAQEGAKATNRQNAEQKSKSGQVWLTNVAHTIREQSGEITSAPSAATKQLWEDVPLPLLNRQEKTEGTA